MQALLIASISLVIFTNILTTTYNTTLLHSSIYYIATMFVSDIIRKVVAGNRALAFEDDCWLIIANG